MIRARNRRHLFPTVALAVIALTLSACTSGGEVVVTVTKTPGQATGPSNAPSVPNQAGGTGPVAPPVSDPPPTAPADFAKAIKVVSDPVFGAKKIAPNTPITLTVFSGTLKDVKVVGDEGSVVDGKLGEGNASFVTSGRLGYGVTYTLTATAVSTGDPNATKPIKGSWTVVNPQETTAALINLRQGGTYGVGQPLSVTFCPAIQDKAAAEQVMKMDTGAKKVEGSWGWLQDEAFSGAEIGLCSQAHWRPKEYWPANTTVKFTGEFKGVNYGNGWGREDVSRSFKIGRSMIIKADVPSFHLVVWLDGKIIRNYPVSYGRGTENGTITVEGPHIIQKKDPMVKMSNPEYGYVDLPEKWAQRINNNGEFIHANEATEKKPGVLGKKNITHGCVNMGLKDAKDLYDMTLIGDPVEVTNTPYGVKMSEKDYIYDWKYSWEEWKALSALGNG